MSDKLKELETKLRDMNPDEANSEARVDLLLEMAEEHFSGDDPQRLIELTNEALELAHRLNYPKGEAYGLWYEGLSCCFIADHERGLQRVDESRARLETMGDDIGVAKAIMLKANILRSIGSFDQALPGLYEALDFFQKCGDRYWEANCNYSLGLLYHEIRDYKQALEQHRKCIEVMKDLPERWLVARALNGVGQALNELEKHEEALHYHHRSLALFREIGHAMGEARALDDIGSIYMQLGDHELALPFHTKSLAIRKTIGQRRAQCTSLLNIAKVHVRQKNHARALEILDEALSIAEETKSKPHIYDAHHLISEACELQGDHKRALDHHKTSHHMKEEVFSENAADRIRKLQIGFEVQKAEKEAEIARLKNVELHEKNARLEELLRELRVTQSQLVQSEKMAAIGKLVAGVVHEMNTPIGASNSAIDVSDRCIKKIADLKETCESIEEMCANGQLESLLERVQNNQRITREANERISRILANLKTFIRLDDSEKKVVDLHEGLESVLALLESEYGDRVTIVKEYGQIPAVDCFPGEMNQVFMSVLTNAMEAIKGKGSITIRTLSKDGDVLVAISDTGPGIAPDIRQRLFDPAFSTKGNRVKAGMGLLTSLNIVQKHGGRIDTESEVGKGSTFTIVLPRVQTERDLRGNNQSSAYRPVRGAI
ncbi:MAG: tetratricopeptide repeat protein [Candidatus Latescibacterota bacterium]|nr:MAG: tetratricopeptide repeat protein [Candidatus Latescibacterota bacterium]